MSTSTQGRWAAAVAAAAVVAMGAAAWPFTVDDAWIVARYAARLAEGQGWTFGDGPPTDGVTGPLWALPMALGRALGLGPVPLAKALGLACMAVAAAIAVRGAARSGALAGWAAAVALAAQPTLGLWGGAGLETGAATLALVLAAVGALAPAGPRPWLAGGAVAALAWLRPEALPAGAALLAAAGLRDRRAALRAAGLAAAGLLAVVAFRLAMFGHPLPLAASAKPPSLGSGFGYVGRATLAVTGGLGLVPVALAVRAGCAGARPLALAATVHLLAVGVAGGDWMPGYRLIAPALPLYAWPLGQGVAMLRPLRAGRLLAGLALVLACAVPALDLAVQLPRARAAGLRRERIARPFARELGRRYDRVALVDVGFVGWVGELEVVDLGGLTDPRVGRAPGGHLAKRIDPGYLAARDPDAIVLHSARRPVVDERGRLRRLAGFAVERRVAAMPWVRERFRVQRVVRYHEGYWYVVLAREPDGNAATATRWPSSRPCAGGRPTGRPGPSGRASAAASAGRGPG